MSTNAVLFEGTDSSGRTGLWETNGTAAGTFELTGITGAATSGLYPSDLTNFNGEVLFTSFDASGGIGLWVTDGTAAGTHELVVAGALAQPQYPFLAGLGPSDLTVYDGHVFFAGVNTSGLVELWETDGTGAGTHQLAIAGTSPGPYSAGISPGLSPSGFTVYDGLLYFAGADASGLFELWETNGTAAGTHELTGVAGAATTGLAPSDLTVFNDQMLFSGADAHGQTGLWVTNGTAAGTHELTGIAGALTTGLGLDPSDLTVYDGKVLFRGIDFSGLYGLWETDGTAAGTHELTGIAAAATTAAGFLPSNLTNYNGEVLFTACDSRGLYGLWVTNGTAGGTHELTSIAGAQTRGIGLDPTDFTVYNGEVLFTGYDSSGKLGLWATNGTVAGTHELTGVTAAAAGLAPSDLTAIGGPALTAGVSIEYLAGGAAVTLDAGLSISDTELTGLIGATVSIGAGFLVGDALRVGSPQTGIVSSYNAATGILTLSGAESLSAYQAELDSVTFASASASNPSRTIVWSVNDGLATSASVSSSVSVERADPPAVDLFDILWESAGGQATIWEMNGLNLVAGAGVDPNPGPAWQTIGAGDFGGSSSDLLWQNANGQVAIWEMNETNIIGGGTVSSNPGPAWHAVGTGDFNADGLSDILFQNTSSGQVAVWEMNETNIIGGGTVSSNPGPAWHAVGTGDFNDDGHSDVLFQNASSGQVAIWEMNGLNVIGGGTVSPDPGPSWKAIGTGDFNDDGHSDILFQNTSSGQVAIWEMNGTYIIGGGTVSANPGPSWQAIGADAGGADILFQNTSGQAAIWDMSGTNIAGGGVVGANPGVSWKAIGLS